MIEQKFNDSTAHRAYEIDTRESVGPIFSIFDPDVSIKIMENLLLLFFLLLDNYKKKSRVKRK